MSREPQLCLNTAPDGYVVRPRALYGLNMCASLCPPLVTQRNIHYLEGLQGFSELLSSPLQLVAVTDTTKGSLKSNLWTLEGLKLINVPPRELRQVSGRQHNLCVLPHYERFQMCTQHSREAAVCRTKYIHLIPVVDQ